MPAPDSDEQGWTQPEPTTTSTSARSVVVDGPQRAGWVLRKEETFDASPDFQSQPWVVDPHGDASPWNVGEFDDDGKYFDILGGPDFERALDAQDVMRKRVEVGDDSWLTVELAARDRDKDGTPDDPPSLDIADGEATINVPAWDGGLVLTGTDTLPDEYRIEYELKTFDFGGKRDGQWDYDGKTNGNTITDECKTNFPWVREGDYSQGGADTVDPCAKPWGTVMEQNGYYLLSIMDYAKPAPHNNLFIHSHRKVGMDTYAVNGDWNDVYWTCDGETGELIHYDKTSANGVNQIFFDGTAYRNPDFAYNEFIMPTTCGTFYGYDPEAEIVSSAELQPQLMPEETYTFAIERTADSYVTEMTGNFAYHGNVTIRSERTFHGEADGKPINHYNQTPQEYDGRYNHTLTFEGPHGRFTKEMWPGGSAYPDNFIIGIPHLNYYEGSATIDNLRLYTR